MFYVQILLIFRMAIFRKIITSCIVKDMNLSKIILENPKYENILSQFFVKNQQSCLSKFIMLLVPACVITKIKSRIWRLRSRQEIVAIC